METYLVIGLIVALSTLYLGWNFYAKQIAFWFAPFLFILVWVFWPLIILAVVTLVLLEVMKKK